MRDPNANRTDALNSSDDEAVVDVSDDGRIMDANRGFLEATGCDLDTIEGQQPSVAAGVAMASDLLDALDDGAFLEARYRKQDRGDSEVWVMHSHAHDRDEERPVKVAYWKGERDAQAETVSSESAANAADPTSEHFVNEQWRCVMFVAQHISDAALGESSLEETLGQSIDSFATLRKIIVRFGGEIVKKISERRALCIFPNTAAAVSAATALQETIREQTEYALPMSVAINEGSVVLEPNDVFGQAVNVAARVLERAKPGEILMTGSVDAVLAEDLQAKSRFLDRLSLKGIDKPVKVFELVWDEFDVTQSGPRDNLIEPMRLKLRLRGDEIYVDDRQWSVTIGRGDDVDLAVSDPMASRRHLRIEYRHGIFVLTDESANGTFLRLDDREIYLRRNEHAMLSGNGRIALGAAFEETSNIIEFDCELA
ncbi:MAG: adenylate/guanylate cyclase domain-containing protein [Pseudomonadota bacterium]